VIDALSLGRVLLDTGPLVAILRKKDRHHERCVTTLRQILPPLLTCMPVITEAAWLLREDPRAIQRLLSGPESGLFSVLPLSDEDLPPVAAILTRYKSLKPQLADATLLHLANREQLETIFTLDQRDFSVLRLADKRRLRIVPE
jgi:predicted nucleic acid-binding protein